MSQRRKRTLAILGYIISILSVANIVLWSAHLSTITPYAITKDGEEICCVKGKSSAAKIISDVSSSYGADENTKAISTGLSVSKAPASAKIVDEEEAKQLLEESAAEIKIASAVTEKKEYKPEPTYEKDDSMLAGQSETIDKGEAGEQNVTTVTITTNGKNTSEEVTDVDILDEGKAEVIAKGTRGLPEGEDWESYEGYPVYEGGDDIVETAKSYIGKVPYVWGGKDLKTGVDCSGFIIALYRLYGIELTYPLYKQGVEVPYSEAKPGDILYFPGHYGMYIGNGKMVHASNPRTDVCIGDVSGRKILCVTRIIP